MLYQNEEKVMDGLFRGYENKIDELKEKGDKDSQEELKKVEKDYLSLKEVYSRAVNYNKVEIEAIRLLSPDTGTVDKNKLGDRVLGIITDRGKGI